MTIQIKGLDQLLANFKKAGVALPAEFRQAMAYSVNAIRTTAQQLVPVKTNALRTSITTTVSDNPLVGQVLVGQPYGKYVEYGTAPHTIYPVNAQALAFTIGNSLVFAKSVHHPGTRPQPFIGPAVEQNIQKVKGYFVTAVNKVLGYIAS